MVSTNPERGTINVRDQLSAKPVTFTSQWRNQIQLDERQRDHGRCATGLADRRAVFAAPRPAVAQEITVVAKPGDNYIFSGMVTDLNMRTSSFFVDNKTDDQSYEVHFARNAVSDMQALRVGAEVTARAVFDGKQYTASNVRVEKPEAPESTQPATGQQSEVQ